MRIYKYIFPIFFFSFSVVNAQKKWTLQECIHYAFEHNLHIKQSRLEKNNQENNLKTAKKERIPSVSATVSNMASFGQNQDVFGNHRRNDNFNNSVNIGASVTLYNGSRLEKQIQKSQYEVEASAYDLERIKSDISLQIAQQYLNILLNREVENINKSAYENAQKVYEKAEITTRVGTTAQTVLAEANASMAREYQNMKSAEVNTKNALFSLALLLQLEDYKNFDVAGWDVAENVEKTDFSVSEVLEKAYSWHPQIKGAEARIKASEMQTKIANTGFLPSITASAGVGTFYFNALNNSGNRNFGQQYKDNFGQQIGLTANIPIFNKGITKIQVEQAKINEDIAKNNLQQQKQELLQNIQKAEYTAENNFEVYKSAVEAEKSSKLALDFMEKSYQAGKSSIYDLNTARNNYVNAQGSAAQAKYNYLYQVKLLEFYAKGSLVGLSE